MRSDVAKKKVKSYDTKAERKKVQAVRDSLTGRKKPKKK